MANKVIKGLTVEISGDTTKLGKAIDDADKRSRDLSAELSQINKLLNFDDANPELLAQKQKVLSEQIANTSEKLQMLKSAQEQVADAFQRGEASAEQLRAVEREVIGAENALKKYQAAADETAQKVAKLGAETAETNNAAKPLTETVRTQEKELSALKNQYADVAASKGRDSEEAKKLLSAIGNLSAELVDNKQKMQAAKQTADQYDSTVAKNATTTLSLTETVKAQEKELSALKSQYADTAVEQGKDSAEAKALAAQITALSGELSKNKTSLHDAQTAADAFDETVSKTETVTKSLSETIADQQNELSALKEKYADTAAAKGKDSAEAKALARQIEALSGELRTNQQKLRDAESAADAFDKTVDDLGDSAKDTEHDLSGLTDALGACLKAATAAAAAVGAAAVKLTVDAVNSFGELEQNLGGAEAVFDKLGNSIEDMQITMSSTDAFGNVKNEVKSLAEVSEDAYRTMGISQSDYLASINKMGALFQGSGLEQQEALDLSANAMQRAADVASVMGLDMQAAMESVTGAAKGNFTMMDNLGVAMNATTLEAYALKNGLIAEGEASVDVKKVADAQDKAAKATLNAEKAQITYNEAVSKYGEDSTQAQKALINLQKAQVDVESTARKVDEAMAGADESSSGWWKNASNADKARVAMQMFLETTEQYDGNFAREANETISGSFGLLESSLSSLTAGLGNADADIEHLTGNVVDAFLSVTKNVIPVVESIGEALPDAIGTLVNGASEQLPALLPVLTDTLTNIIGALVDAFPDIANQILTLVLNLAPALISAAMNLLTSLTTTVLDMAPDILRTLMQVSVGVITSLGEALPDLLDMLISDVIPALLTNFFAYLPDVIEALTNAVSAIADRLPDIIQGLVDYLPEIIDTVIYGITQSIPSIIAALVKVFKAVAAAIPALVKALPDVVNMLVGGIADMLPMLLDGITELVDALVSALPDIIQTLCKALPDIITGIVDTLTALLPQLIDCGIRLLTSLIAALPQIIQTICAALPTLIKGIVDGILSAVPQLIQCGITLLTALVSALPEIIKQICAALPQISKSIVSALIDTLPLLIDCGVKLLVALVENLPQIITEIVKALPDIIDGIITALIGMIPQIIECGIKLFVALIENLPAIIAGVVEAVPKIITAIVDGFMERISAIAEVGENIVKGLWEGIKNVGAWIKEKISRFFDGIVDGIKDFFGIESPSKLMRDQIGKNIALGVAEGIEDNGDAVSDAMQDMADTVADTEITPPEIEVPDFDLPDFAPVKIPVSVEPELDSIEPEFSFDGVQRSLHMTSEQTVIMAVDPEMMAKLDQILGAVQDGKEILLDGDALVGGTAGKYNTAFGEMQVLSERSVT